MKTLDQISFNDFVSQESAVLEFYADWCGPCKAMNKVLAEVEKDYDTNVAKLNVDVHPNIASAFDIVSIPTTIFFKDGREVSRVMGAKSVTALTDALGVQAKTQL